MLRTLPIACPVVLFIAAAAVQVEIPVGHTLGGTEADGVVGGRTIRQYYVQKPQCSDTPSVPDHCATSLADCGGNREYRPDEQLIHKCQDANDPQSYCEYYDYNICKRVFRCVWVVDTGECQSRETEPVTPSTYGGTPTQTSHLCEEIRDPGTPVHPPGGP